MNGTLAVPPSGVDTLGKADIDVQGGNNYTYMAKWETQLFNNPGPKIEDVRQGGIGNCYILAALMAVLQQPKGPEFVMGMMYDLWNPMAPRPSLTNPAYVVVRLYDAGGSAHYVKIRKMTVIDSRTISSHGAQQAFADGPLWVSIFEQAFLALDANGHWNTGSPKFSNMIGSNTSYSALKAILGADVGLHPIPDMADPTARAGAFASNTTNSFGMPQTLFFEQAMNPAEIGKAPIQNSVKAQIFGGQQNLFAQFLAWAQAQDMTAPPMMAAVSIGSRQAPVRPTHLKVFRDKIYSKPKSTIRYEDIEAFFTSKNLDNATAQAALNWLETNKVVPGKKFTKIYSQWEEWVYTRLEEAETAKRPAVLCTRSHIGVSEGSGHSANEPKVKGLVADHEYPLIGVENDGGRKFVIVRNPWGEYGRTYVPDSNDMRPRAASHAGPVSRLPLQEITKRFRRFQISNKSLA